MSRSCINRPPSRANANAAAAIKTSRPSIPWLSCKMTWPPSWYSLKRRCLDSGDFSVPLAQGNDDDDDESFASYVFLHSTVSRPASSPSIGGDQSSAVSSGTSYPNPQQQQEEPVLVGEEFYAPAMSPSECSVSTGGSISRQLPRRRIWIALSQLSSALHASSILRRASSSPIFAPPKQQQQQQPQHRRLLRFTGFLRGSSRRAVSRSSSIVAIIDDDRES